MSRFNISTTITSTVAVVLSVVCIAVFIKESAKQLNSINVIEKTLQLHSTKISYLQSNLEDFTSKNYSKIKQNKRTIDKLVDRHIIPGVDLRPQEVFISSYIKRRYTKTPTELANTIAKVAYRLCEEHKINPDLVVGIIETESMFNPYAESSVGARGLMQVRFSVWSNELGLKSNDDLFDIEAGIDAGIRVLTHYVKKNDGDIRMALRNYNGANDDRYYSKVLLNIGRFTLHRYERIKGNKND